MKMDGWEDYLHFSLHGEHVLFGGLRLDTPGSFIVASFVSILVCITERLLTYALSVHWNPLHIMPNARLCNAAWRASLYWVVTLDRLLYMLIAMTFNIGLLVIVVSTLAFGQFIIEYVDMPAHAHARSDPESMKEPLLSRESYDSSFPPSRARSPNPPPSYPPHRTSPAPGRPRSKSKPDDIFIHPTESNIVRADMAAMQLGLGGDTERVKANLYPDDEEAWELGKGPEVARELLGAMRAS